MGIWNPWLLWTPRNQTTKPNRQLYSLPEFMELFFWGVDHFSGRYQVLTFLWKDHFSITSFDFRGKLKPHFWGASFKGQEENPMLPGGAAAGRRGAAELSGDRRGVGHQPKLAGRCGAQRVPWLRTNFWTRLSH